MKKIISLKGKFRPPQKKQAPKFSKLKCLFNQLSGFEYTGTTEKKKRFVTSRYIQRRLRVTLVRARHCVKYDT